MEPAKPKDYDKRFLIQKLKSDKSIVTIGVLSEECNEYDTDFGFIHEDYKTDIFEYTYLTEGQLVERLTDFENMGGVL